MNNIEALAREAIDRIRPYIRMDGGDIEFVSMNENGVVTVRMLGACMGCASIDSTLKDGVEAILLEEVPGVTEVLLEEIDDPFGDSFESEVW